MIHPEPKQVLRELGLGPDSAKGPVLAEVLTHSREPNTP